MYPFRASKGSTKLFIVGNEKEVVEAMIKTFKEMGYEVEVFF